MSDTPVFEDVEEELHNSDEEVEEVDTPDASDDESDEVEETDKAETKKEKKPARPPVPTGYISPVAFAKELTKHLQEQGKMKADDEVRPQVIYSYIRNTAKGKNPLPTYEEGGRQNLLKLDEALAWWDAKDERVSARKANAAEKKAKKEANAEKKDEKSDLEGVVEAEGEFEEAE